MNPQGDIILSVVLDFEIANRKSGKRYFGDRCYPWKKRKKLFCQGATKRKKEVEEYANSLYIA